MFDMFNFSSHTQWLRLPYLNHQDRPCLVRVDQIVRITPTYQVDFDEKTDARIDTEIGSSILLMTGDFLEVAEKVEGIEKLLNLQSLTKS